MTDINRFISSLFIAAISMTLVGCCNIDFPDSFEETFTTAYDEVANQYFHGERLSEAEALGILNNDNETVDCDGKFTQESQDEDVVSEHSCTLSDEAEIDGDEMSHEDEADGSSQVESSKPESSQVEPSKPEPSQDEPSKPEPSQPEPTPAAPSEDEKSRPVCAHGNTSVEIVSSGNCTDKEVSRLVCNDCKEILDNQILGATNPGIHKGYVENKISTATYGKEGRSIFTCSCGDSYEEVYPAIESGSIVRNGVTYQFSTYLVDIGNGEYATVCGFYDYNMAAEVFRLLNEYRVECGKNELETDSTLEGYALLRIVESSYSFSHTRPNGSSCSSVGDMCGENLMHGPDLVDAQFAINSWKNSPGHNSNMLRGYSKASVACFCRVAFTEDNVPYVDLVTSVQCFWW